MAEDDEPKASIYLALDNPDPIDAAELAKLLRALHGDYKKATKGTLVVSRLRIGSTELWLTDAQLVAAAVTTFATAVVMSGDATERIAKFWRYLRKYLRSDKAPPDEYESLPVRSSGEKMVELAAKHGANLKLKQTITAKREVLEIDLSFSDVYRLDARNKRDKELWKTSGQRARALKFDIRPLLAAGASETENQNLVTAIVSSMKRAGHEDMVRLLADDLDAAGRADIAKLVRGHLPTPSKPWGLLPPPERK